MTIDDDEMLDLLGAALMDGVPTDPRKPDLERLRVLAAQRQDQLQSVATLPSRHSRRHRRHLATAAAIAAAIAGGVLMARVQGPASDESAGVVEFEQEIATTGNGRVEVVGRRVGIGRTVEIRSDSFPILPTAEFYEVWFLAAGDTPTTPMRISAGTFHPDLAGRTFVQMTAAVDPNTYPILAITAETADGDPRPSSNEVMRSTLTILD